MPRFRVHYNSLCQDCAKKAKALKRLDWLGRIELSTEDAPDGPVRAGTLAVHDRKTGQTLRGVRAPRAVMLRVPLMLPMALATFLPPVARKFNERAGLA